MSTASEGLAVRGVPLAGEALATWGLRPAQFQSKCRRRYQEGCCRAQGQDPRPWQHPRRRQIDVFGDQSSRFSDSVLHPPQHCRCRPRSYCWQAVQCVQRGCAASHSRARRPASAIWVGFIWPAARSRPSTACCRCPLAIREAARLNHMCACT